MSVMEIYNEQCFDLLRKSESMGGGKALLVREHKTEGFYVDNLMGVRCPTERAALQTAADAIRARKSGSHEMNERSSRSHLMVTLYIDGVTLVSEGHSSETSPSTQGRLCIVDLAGSERLKETQSTNHTLRETGFINKSLYTLGKVINGIAQRGQSRGGGQRREKTSKASVPFRDSVLTKLLISSLGGECMTIMMSCVSPATEAVTESVRTLSFAMRVKGIQNHPTLHVDQQEKMLVDLKKEIDKLKRENVKLREMVVEVQEEAKLGLGKSSNGHIGLVSEMVEWKAEVGVEVQPIKELQPQPPQPVDNDNDVYHDDEFLVEDDDENERSMPKTPPFKSTKAIFSASPQKTQFVAHGSKLEKLERLLLESRAVVESAGGEVGKGVEEIEEEIAELKLELLLTTQLAGLGLDEDEDEDEDEREDEDEEEAAAEKLLEEQLRNLMGGKGGGDEIDDSDSGGEHSHSDDNLVSSEEESGGDWRSKWQENLERMEARSATEQYEGGDEFEFPVDENFLSPPRNLFGQQQQQQQQQHYHQQQQQQHHLPQIKNRKKFFRGGTGGAGVAIYRQENRGLDRKLSKSLQNKNARKRQKF